MDHWKQETRKQWNANPCGLVHADKTIEKYTLEFFDSVANARYQRTDSWIKEKIPFASGSGKKVLEIGFGVGSDLVSWRKHGAECYGIDITPEHYRLATLNFALRKEPVHLQLADASEIPFPANFFDIVYSHGVLHHTPDTVRCISEAYRVLRPKGQLIFTMYRTYSAFHLIRKLLMQGVFDGRLRELGYRGLMSTIEHGADGKTIKPLVKTYKKQQLASILEDFSKVVFKVAHFKGDHVTQRSWLIPQFLEKMLERWLGWYLIAYATK